MKFDIFSGNKSFSNNALIGGNREATKRQTPEEHAALLDPSTTEVGMAMYALGVNPIIRREMEEEAIEQAEEREANSPHYWKDEYPRRDITQSSSWIGNTEYNPDTSITTIAIGKNGKAMSRYTSDDQVDEMLNAPSIGQFVWKNFLR